jgi:mRNA-degrading endonuclease toxin of MazEF toxin-antitoxin module
MRAGDIVRVDFGVPAKGEPGFVRPVVVVTSNDVLDYRQTAIVVVPCTSSRRGWLTQVEVEGVGVVQAHLPTSISVDRIVEVVGLNVGAVVLHQIRERIGELLEIR